MLSTDACAVASVCASTNLYILDFLRNPRRQQRVFCQTRQAQFLNDTIKYNIKLQYSFPKKANTLIDVTSVLISTRGNWLSYII